MSEKKENRKIKVKIIRTTPKFANPAPLGLVAFGISTFLLNLHNIGVWEEFDSMLLGTGIAFGGMCQIIVGIMEFVCNNTSGGLLFFGYGTFWVTLCFSKLLPDVLEVPVTSDMTLFMFCTVWGIFSMFVLLGEFSGKRISALQVIFILLNLLFFLLALKHLLIHYGYDKLSSLVGVFLGYEGVLLGGVALYLGVGTLVNKELEMNAFPTIVPINCGKEEGEEEN